MKTKNRIASVARVATRKPSIDLNDFASVSENGIEHHTVFGFLRRVPHHWQADDLLRFGSRLRFAADAIQLAKVETAHPDLGRIRVYPVALCEWIYNIAASENRWPALPDSAQLEDGSKKRRHALRQIDEAITDAPQTVKDALKVVIDYLECVTGGKQQPHEPHLRPV